MVTNPRAKKGADRLRPLNAPRPICVETDEQGRPARTGRTRPATAVVAILDRWRVEEEWWREAISREYYQVELEDGRSPTLFHDKEQDAWFEQTS